MNLLELRANGFFNLPFIRPYFNDEKGQCPLRNSSGTAFEIYCSFATVRSALGWVLNWANQLTIYDFEEIDGCMTVRKKLVLSPAQFVKPLRAVLLSSAAAALILVGYPWLQTAWKKLSVTAAQVLLPGQIWVLALISGTAAIASININGSL